MAEDTTQGGNGNDTTSGGNDTVKGGNDTVKGGNDTLKGGQPDWRDTITDPVLKDHVKNFASASDLVKGHFELRKKLSTAIIPPGKDAKPEEIAEYRKKTGVPDSAEGYKFFTAEGQQVTDDMKASQKIWGERFQKLGVSSETAFELSKALAEDSAAYAKAQGDADKAYAAQTEAALKKEWGADYEANKTFAKRAAAIVFGDSLKDALNLEGKDGRYLLDNPVMVKAMAKLGREMGEDGLRGTMSDDARSGLENQYNELTTKIHNAHTKGDKIEAQRLLDQRTVISGKLYPNRAA